MTNVKTSIVENILTIIVDLKERHGKSASGKTNTIATSSGNVVLDPETGATLGLNVYTKKD